MTRVRINRIADILKREEGWRPCAYEDSEGYLTIGYGFLIDERRPGAGITKGEGELILLNRIDRLLAELGTRIAFWKELSDGRQAALVCMAYQLGVSGVMGFAKMLDAMGNEDWQRARREALDSAWAKQTPARAERVAKMIEEG